MILEEVSRAIILALCVLSPVYTQEKTDAKKPLPEVIKIDPTPNEPVHRAVGDSVVLTCIVKDIRDHTLLWKYGKDKVIAANTAKITNDKRISIFHDEGGDVWALAIDNLTVKDTGSYVCEVNSNPPKRTFHKLLVMPNTLVPPPLSDGYYGMKADKTKTIATNSSSSKVSEDSMTLWGYSTASPIDHDYTGCCRAAGVSDDCLGFCSISNILEGKVDIHPTECEAHFPSIVSCMADGRNHVPCCEKAGIPDVCQDMCYGQYTMKTDEIRTHISCNAYTAPTLACINEGIDILPGQVREPEVTQIKRNSFSLEWKAPIAVTTVKSFIITVKIIRSMEAGSIDQSGTNMDDELKFKIPGDETSFTIKNLDPFTLYNVTIKAKNEFGESLPSYGIKVVTKSEDQADWQRPIVTEMDLPKLPDVKSCCIRRNITNKHCVNTFCDPEYTDDLSVPDLIVCAPWAEDMFGCMMHDHDLADCCAEERMPEICHGLCSSGNIGGPVDFRYFRCLEHVPKMTNCAMKKMKALPSEPRNFRFSNIGASIGLLHWDVPTTLGDTVSSYVVFYQKMTPGSTARTTDDEKLMKAEEKTTTHVLENLEADSSYEVYVRAKNKHGLGESSTRIVFRTAISSILDSDDSTSLAQDTEIAHAECCVNAGVRSDCQNLCSFSVTTSIIQEAFAGSKGPSCQDELPKLVKCSAGGRDHLPCCQRRGVPEQCLLLCQGIQPEPTSSIMTSCQSFVGNILTCMEEGYLTLPSPVENFHAIAVGDTWVSFEWTKIVEEDIAYNVYYKPVVNGSTAVDIFTSNEYINATDNKVVVSNLTTGVEYQFFAISRNEKGTSLPSSMVTLTIEEKAKIKKSGVPSAPFSIVVTDKSSDYVSLSWTNPAISHPGDFMKYRVYFRVVTANKTINGTTTMVTSRAASVESIVNKVKLTGLNPNTKYIVHVTAINNKGESRPSEELTIWSNPIVSAYVEPPQIHPSDDLVEGATVQVLCIAMGSPIPEVSLYVSGNLLRTEKSRHMITTLYNITRHFDSLSCHAENGYGTPSHQTRRLRIRRSPRLVSENPPGGQILVWEGQTVTVTFIVDSYPEPTIRINRNGKSLMDGDKDGKVRIEVHASDDVNARNNAGEIKITLTIIDANISDDGIYTLLAANEYGTLNKQFHILTKVAHRLETEDTNTCCHRLNVSDACIGICNLAVDLDLLLNKPECFAEFDKLMECASDGSDHRHCCTINSVPRPCLNWCRGIEIHDRSQETCAISHSRTIARCFNEGVYTLPGPVKNIEVTPLTASSALVRWDPPEKNPEVVEIYRILWRKKGTRLADKVDTSETEYTFKGLDPGVEYELSVKAGNENGTSQLSPSIQFITANEYRIESTRVFSPLPSIIGLGVALCLLIPFVVFVLWFFKSGKRLPLSRSNSANNSGDHMRNPFYNQEITMSQLQMGSAGMTNTEAAMDEIEVSSGPEATSSEVGVDDKEQKERKPKFFEGLKQPFGKGGDGFQRFE